MVVDNRLTELSNSQDSAADFGGKCFTDSFEFNFDNKMVQNRNKRVHSLPKKLKKHNNLGSSTHDEIAQIELLKKS